MKRSETIAFLADILEDYENDDYREETEDFADFILMILEKKGLISKEKWENEETPRSGAV